jgi:exocyst complex component 4
LSMKAAAALASSGDVHDTALQLLNFKAQPAGTSRAELTTKEVAALLAATKANPLSPYDIISDPKSVHQLSLLYNSMQWLAAALLQIRHVDSAGSHTRSKSRGDRRWTLLKSISGSSGISTTHPGGLPLTAETAIAFDQTIASIRNLAQTALLTLHIDVRCGLMLQLSQLLRGPASTSAGSSDAEPPLDSGLYTYILPAPSSQASPLILKLSNDLMSFDENLTSSLGTEERRFILKGLSKLVDKFWVKSCEGLGAMNGHGAERMGMDVVVVQQNLRAILANASTTAEDERSAQNGDGGAGGLGISASSPVAEDDDDDGRLVYAGQYFDLFLSGPDSILSYVRDCKSNSRDVGFSYDELRTLIELCYSARLRGEDREESVKARKGMQDKLLALGEGMWDS